MQEIEAAGALDLILDRAVRIAIVRNGLEQALDELDQLELWQAGAHLSMAVHALGDAPRGEIPRPLPSAGMPASALSLLAKVRQRSAGRPLGQPV